MLGSYSSRIQRSYRVLVHNTLNSQNVLFYCAYPAAISGSSISIDKTYGDTSTPLLYMNYLLLDPALQK